MPRNKWLLLALLWLLASIYALVLRENDNGSLKAPFAHFDKFVHAALFFAQLWLLAKAWLAEKRPLPLRTLLAFAVIYAAASELAQHYLTRTRSGDILDFAADLCGAGLALYFAVQIQQARSRRTEDI